MTLAKQILDKHLTWNGYHVKRTRWNGAYFVYRWGQMLGIRCSRKSVLEYLSVLVVSN